MLLFRILCALFMAWGINFALSRPEGALLREEVPEFAAIAPLMAALFGFISLAKRQGWGPVVALANGIWACFLTLFFSGVAYVAFDLSDTARVGDVKFEFIANIMSENVALVVDQLSNFALLLFCFGTSAVVGVITELIHWALVKIRERRGVKERNMKRAERPSMY